VPVQSNKGGIEGIKKINQRGEQRGVKKGISRVPVYFPNS